MNTLEEHIAHLTRTVEELSDVVARQDQEIAQLTRRVAMLMQREADRAVEDLSAIVARQDGELSRMTRRVRMLMEREAAREQEGTGGIVLGDERPPHY